MAELVREMSPEVQNKIAALRKQTRVTLMLAVLREKSGITQKEMAQALGVRQSTISKLEAGRDDKLTLRIISGYAEATKQRINLRF